jgi:kynurenine formamidase
MNTQCTSQWDGFRHFGLPIRQEEGSCVFYNNWSGEELEGNDEIGTDGESETVARMFLPLMQTSLSAWLKSGGIVGRGVLLDFARWAKHRGEEVNVNLGRLITLADIQSILEYQQTMVHPGDILIIRTGWLQWYNHTCPQERHFELCSCHSPGTHAFIGIEASKNFVAWLWNNQIAAVAGDQVAFESTPPPATGFGSLHQHLLAALGCPMGELWNTETLAKACEKRGRWSFLLTSAPLHIRGGVASPANAVAVL